MAKQCITWISESEAAQALGLTPKYFRRKVRSGEVLNINYTRPSRNTYQYNAADIEAYKIHTSTITQRA